MRRFVGTGMEREPEPHAIAICKFRNLLKAHNLCDQLFSK
jgi:IS5 family transposase